MARTHRDSRRDSRGQSLVEFALVLPVFILVLMGIVDLGRAVYGYNTANNAAREASRLAIVDQTVTDIEDRAIQHAVSLGLDATDIDVDFRDADTPNTAGSCSTPAIGCLATVEVRYTYTPATPVIGNVIGPINIVGKSQFAIEAVCVSPADGSCPKGE